jgi:hypothetical protein
MSNEDKINYIREQINNVDDEIRSLKQKKFELKKELLQEIHQFKIGDFVVYKVTEDRLVWGRIDIINESNRTDGGKAIIYSNKPSENYFQAKQYTILYLHDWVKERDQKLRILSSHLK